VGSPNGLRVPAVGRLELRAVVRVANPNGTVERLGASYSERLAVNEFRVVIVTGLACSERCTK
jgi:hypothetical protein